MSSFTFVAHDGSGQVQRGNFDAASASAMAGNLRERGWLIIDIRPAAGQPTLSDQVAVLNPLHYLPPRSGDVELSLHQLAVMLRGGLTLLAAIRTAAEQSGRLTMRKVWEQVADRIQAGSTLADAMAEHRCFSKLVVQLVRVGEQTGNLEQVVVRSADILEKRRQLWSSLATALAYPSLVLLAAIGVTIFMLVSVIPKLQVFLGAAGRKLPWMTQFLVDLADYVQIYLPYFLAGPAALTGAAIALYSWPPGRLWVEHEVWRAFRYRTRNRCPSFEQVLRRASSRTRDLFRVQQCPHEVRQSLR